MGNTYKRHRSDVEEEFAGKRQGKVSKHSNNRKTHGMQTLNNYVELNDEDVIDSDEVIQHIYTTNTISYEGNNNGY
jgi:hypothetical protein